MSKIYLFVSVDVLAQNRATYLELLETQVAVIQTEPGCEEIGYFAEENNEGQIHLWEVWSTRADWEAHMKNPTSGAWKLKIKDLVLGESIKVLSKL